MEQIATGNATNANMGTEAAPSQSDIGGNQKSGSVGEVNPSESRNTEDQRISRGLEIIAKRERELLQREESYKQELQRRQELERKLQEYENDFSTIDIDPMEILKKKGWDLERLANHISKTNDPIAGSEKAKLYGTIESLNNEIKSLKEELSGQFKKRDEQEKERSIGEVKKRLYGDLQNMVDKNPEKYELVKGYNAFDTVFQVLSDYYEAHGKPLAHEEALDLVEEHIQKQLETEHERMLKYNKFKSKLGGLDTGNSSDNFFMPEEDNQPPRTLNSNFSQTTPPTSQRQLTREESLRRASELIRFDG